MQGSGWWIVSTLALAALVVVIVVRHRRAMEDIRRGLVTLVEARPIRPIRARPGGVPPALADWMSTAAPALQGRLESLERDHRQLQMVLGGMTEGVIAVDARSRLLFANPAARRMFGLDATPIGRLLPELIRIPQIQRSLEAALAGGAPDRVQVAIPGPDILAPHRDRILTIEAVPTPDANTPGALLVFHDETELRRLERMRQDFVANASHELKTPLSSIKVNTETLLDWGLADESVNVTLLRQIEEQVDRLDALIQDMLSLARLEVGDDPFPLEPVALRRSIETIAATHEIRAIAKGLGFTVDLEALPRDVQIRGAAETLRQVLDNLIDNAIKYTTPGGLIRVAASIVEGRAELVVADTGVGIPREDQPRIFERFYRVDKARSRTVGGTGLGLAIVKHGVQALGGQISLESTIGSGSTFTVRLPIAD